MAAGSSADFPTSGHDSSTGWVKPLGFTNLNMEISQHQLGLLVG